MLVVVYLLQISNIRGVSLCDCLLQALRIYITSLPVRNTAFHASFVEGAITLHSRLLVPHRNVRDSNFPHSHMFLQADNRFV